MELTGGSSSFAAALSDDASGGIGDHVKSMNCDGCFASNCDDVKQKRNKIAESLAWKHWCTLS